MQIIDNYDVLRLQVQRYKWEFKIGREEIAANCIYCQMLLVVAVIVMKSKYSAWIIAKARVNP